MLIPPLVNIFPGSSNKSKNSSENRFDHALGVHCHPLRYSEEGDDVGAFGTGRAQWPSQSLTDPTWTAHQAVAPRVGSVHAPARRSAAGTAPESPPENPGPVEISWGLKQQRGVFRILAIA